MPEIDRLLRRAAIRLMLVRFVRVVVVGLGIGVVLLVALRLAERLLALTVDWQAAWLGTTGLAVFAAVAWVVVFRPNRMGVAREVDERADLRESLGTALCVMQADDGWSRATVEHARGLCRRVVVRQLFPFTLHRSWPTAIVGAILFLLLGLIPQADLLSFLRTAQAKEQAQADVAAAQQEVESAEKKVRDALKDVPELEEALKDKQEDSNDAKTPEEIRRESVKKLTTLSDKLDEMQNSESAKTLEEMGDRMAKLDTSTGMKDLDSMLKSLQKGDFENASKSLEGLAKKLESANLTDEQKQAIAEAMAKLGEQMQQLAAQQQALQNQLAQMGLDPSLANNPQALQQAIQNAQNLTQAQKDQLMKTAKACQNASQMCSSMAGACQNAAMSLAQGGNGKQGIGMLGQQLSQAEMLQQQMKSLSAAQGIVANQLQSLGSGMGTADMMDIYKRFELQQAGGRGAGTHGHSGSRDPNELNAQYNLDPSRTSGTFDPDTPIIGETLALGTQLKGEAAQELHDAVHASSEAASEAIETKVIPREYHDAIKHYFGNLEKESETTATTPGTDKSPAESGASSTPESSSGK